MLRSDNPSLQPGVEVRPSAAVGGRDAPPLLVAACTNGGNVLACVAQSVQEWGVGLAAAQGWAHGSASLPATYAWLEAEGMAALARGDPVPTFSRLPLVERGEEEDPGVGALAGLARCGVSGLPPPPLLYVGVAIAVSDRLLARLPARAWEGVGIVLGVGGALAASGVLRTCMERAVSVASGGRARFVLMEDAASAYGGCVGAALAAVH